jgi:hypothetical protein
MPEINLHEGWAIFQQIEGRYGAAVLYLAAAAVIVRLIVIPFFDAIGTMISKIKGRGPN